MLILSYIVFILFRTTFGYLHSNVTDHDPTNKTVVVTGAAQGIGRSIAENFIIAGARVVLLLDIKVKKGRRTAEYFNCKYGHNKAVFIECDITKSLVQVSTNVIKEFGYVDLLVNNAGILNENCPMKVIETNLIATTRWSQKFFEIMRRDKGGKCGTIINIASISGHLYDPFTSIYKCTKFGVIGLSKSLGHEYTFRETCVRVMALCPGYTYTAMTRQQMVKEEHKDVFHALASAYPGQTSNAVGLAAVEIYKKATTGTSWDVIGGNPPKPAPALNTIPIELFDNV